MIVTDLAMTNIIENLLHEHIILLAPNTIQHPLVSHINLTLGLMNAPQVMSFNKDFLDAKSFSSKPPTDRSRSRSHSNSKTYPNYQYNPTGNFTEQLPSLIHHPPSLHPSLKSLCTIQTPPHRNTLFTITHSFK